MRAARALVMAVCVAAFVMLIASGPGTRLGLWPWQTGISLVKWAAYTGMAGGVGALVLIALLAVPRWRVRPWVPVLALAYALAAFIPPLILLEKAKSVPPIHDITTDSFDPPAFNALMPVRKLSPNGADYGGVEVAKQQQKGYPDIKSLIVKTPPAETVQKALDAARASGWEVVSSDAPTGRIEATDTTLWFGFKDDIVVRVRPDAAGSRVDVRSVSRVGESDVGANAKRIREFLSRLA
ncbi:MAG: DUF1499 domain-containing protein [Burkholderiales bacterium]|nr:DUF1499 domain-containing protein [Burkholderiales bacterium]